MSESSFVVEEDVPHHFVGHLGDLVVVMVHDGSQDDDSHVRVGARLVDRLSRARKAPVRLLMVLPLKASRPPTAKVRGAFLEEGRRLEGRVSRLAVVVASSGFAAAIQRGALIGIVTLLRPKTPMKVAGDLPSGIDFLVEGDAALRAPLLRLCEEHLGKPGT